MDEKRILKKNKKFYIGILGTVLEGLLSGGLFILLEFVLQSLWDQNFDMKRGLRLTGMLFFVFLVRILIYSYAYTKAQIGGAQVSQNIRFMLGDKLKKMPLAGFTKGQIGDYIQAVTTDVNNYEKIVTHKVGDMAKNLALSVMLILFVMTLYVPAGILLLLSELLLIPALLCSFQIVRKDGQRKNKSAAENVSRIVEYITGIQTFRAYGVGGTKNKTLVQAMKNFSEISFVYEAKVLPIGTLLGILIWCVCPLIMWLAYPVYSRGELTTVTYLMLCLLPLFFGKLVNALFIDLTSYKNLMISKQKIMKIMQEPEESGRHEALKPNHHGITFQDVAFSYNGEETILKDLNFTAADRQLTALVGDSGSGKSTILNLIGKYYEASAGKILIGDQAIQEYAAECILEQISMVDQEVFLFNATVRENIRYANPLATDAEIEVACKAANCEAFIFKLEKGYETLIGENGNLLSGGERQRLSIARALIKESPILLLDEATSALDIENELAVRQALLQLLKQKKTVLMIAHTLAIIKGADQILVISGGKIAESGRHEELLRKNGKYAKMWAAEQKNSS